MLLCESVLPLLFVCGKGSFTHAVFRPLLNHWRMGLGPGKLPYREIRSTHSLCRASHFAWCSCGNILPCVILNECSFVLHKNMSTALRHGPSFQYFRLHPGGIRILLLLQERGKAHTLFPCVRCQGHQLLMRLTLLELILHCRSSLGAEASFHPVLDCVVFSFAALIPSCGRKKCFDFSSWVLAP